MSGKFDFHKNVRTLLLIINSIYNLCFSNNLSFNEQNFLYFYLEKLKKF